MTNPIVSAAATPEELARQVAARIAEKRKMVVDPTVLQPIAPEATPPMVLKVSAITIELDGKQYQLQVDKEFHVPKE